MIFSNYLVTKTDPMELNKRQTYKLQQDNPRDVVLYPVHHKS
jgi:hypothetical protein